MPEDNVVVRFLADMLPFNAGETAGFPRERAESLRARKLVEFVDEDALASPPTEAADRLMANELAKDGAESDEVKPPKPAEAGE